MPILQQSNWGGAELADLGVFVAVAQALSFARAGERLGKDATVVSRRIKTLESRLGVRLLQRTTRSVTLTEAGRRYLTRVQPILLALEDAEREAASFATGEPRGHLRLALPGPFGRLWVAPYLGEFMKRHPQITIEAELSNRFVDLVAEGFDLALRLGELSDTRLVARKVAERRRLLVASPEYLARAGRPRVPQELSKHDCLVFSGLENRGRWDMVDARGRRSRVTVAGPLIADDAELLLEAASAGLGIALATDWLASRALQEGRLVSVLPRWQMVDKGAVYIVTPSGSHASSKTKVFADWLAAKLSDPPWRARARARRKR